MSKMENYSADIPQSLRQADQVLTLYGRWAMDKPVRRTCGSAEGRYVIPPVSDEDQRRTPRQPGLNVEERVAAQRALARVPDIYRSVLAALYVPQTVNGKVIRLEVVLRTLRIPPRLMRERHIAGLRMFDNIYRVVYTMRAPDTASVSPHA